MIGVNATFCVPCKLACPGLGVLHSSATAMQQRCNSSATEVSNPGGKLPSGPGPADKPLDSEAPERPGA